MRRKLLLNDGLRERELQLVGRIVVGRDPACEISHDDSLLSRRHAEFLASADVVKVRDLGSRNGVFVNGTRAVERVLAEGDVIQIGPLRARFLIDRAVAGIAPEEFDGDRTAVIRKVFAGQSSTALADSGLSDDTDQDATRLVPAPAITEDDGPTLFVAAPPAGAAVGHPAGSTTLLDTPVRAVPAPFAASRVPLEKELRAAVFVQLLVLSGMILAASTVLQAMTLSLKSLALCGAIALIASAVTSSSISRRMGRTIDEIERGGR